MWHSMNQLHFQCEYINDLSLVECVTPHLRRSRELLFGPPFLVLTQLHETKILLSA